MDELTGLPNRRALAERLRSARNGSVSNMTLLMLDLDGFKSVNDRYGHEVGDEVLRCVAERLRRIAVRWPGMLVARLGGDEFSCVIDFAISESVLEQLAEALVREVAAPMPQCVPDTIGVSVGIASMADLVDSSALLRRADDAMYRAKRAGGGCFAKAQATQGMPLLYSEPMMV